jgi:hypothetical protein
MLSFKNGGETIFDLAVPLVPADPVEKNEAVNNIYHTVSMKYVHDYELRVMSSKS